MYPISNAFLTAVKANTRKYYWTGLELKKYGNQPVLTVERRHRFTSSFSDFITRFVCKWNERCRQTVRTELFVKLPGPALQTVAGIAAFLQKMPSLIWVWQKRAFKGDIEECDRPGDCHGGIRQQVLCERCGFFRGAGASWDDDL